MRGRKAFGGTYISSKRASPLDCTRIKHGDIGTRGYKTLMKLKSLVSSTISS